MIDKVDIASKNWAEDYLTENGRRFNNMLRDAFITGFKKGVQLSRRKRGKWIDMDDHVMCSCCGATHYGADKNYCPNCGAYMGKETDSE